MFIPTVLLLGTILHVYKAPVVRLDECILAEKSFVKNLTVHLFIWQVVTILVSQNANLGAVRSTAIPLLKEALEPLCTTLLDSLAPQEADPSFPSQGYYQ